MNTDIIPHLQLAIKAPPVRIHPNRQTEVIHPMRNLAAAVVRLAIQDCLYPNSHTPKKAVKDAANFLNGDGRFILSKLVPELFCDDGCSWGG